MIEAYESVYSYRNDRYIAEHGISATGNMAVRADVFRKVGPFGGITTMEDTEWGKRATAMGLRAAFLPQARVLTPSCKSFDELARRWDRHVAHEFRHVRGNRRNLLSWGAKTFAVAASPLAEVATLLRSKRLRGLDQRLLAFACLVRVRLYRAWLMARLALRDDTATVSAGGIATNCDPSGLSRELDAGRSPDDEVSKLLKAILDQTIYALYRHHSPDCQVPSRGGSVLNSSMRWRPRADVLT